MRAPRKLMITAALLLSLGTAGCGGGDDSSTPAANPPGSSGGTTAPPAGGKITIAAFNFGESAILAAMYEKVLDKAGFTAEVKSLTNREVIEPALEKGDLDLVPEYVGTLTEFLNKKANGPNATAKASGDLAATVGALRTLAEPLQLTVLEPSQAADQNAFAVTEKFAADNNLSSLSDLAGYSGSLVLGGPPECPTRPFCRPGLESTYGLKFSSFKSLDAGGPLTKAALKSGAVQLGLVFSSDGGIEANGLRVLEDDKNLQTVDNIVPVVRTDKVTDALRTALNELSETLTTEDLIALNKKVDVDRQKADKVAEEYLKEKGLL